MASNARQSVFGGFFALSLNLVVLPFFMRLRSSRGNDPNHVPSHRVADEQHPAVDQTDGAEARLATGIAIVELDHVWVQEHLRGRSKVDTVFLSVGAFLGTVPFEVHGAPRPRVYTDIQYRVQEPRVVCLGAVARMERSGMRERQRGRYTTCSALLDHLVGQRHQIHRQLNARRLGGLEIDR